MPLTRQRKYERKGDWDGELLSWKEVRSECYKAAGVLVLSALLFILVCALP